MMKEYALKNAGGIQSISSEAHFNPLTPRETVSRLVSMATGPPDATFKARKFIEAVHNEDETEPSFIPLIFAVNKYDEETNADALNVEINSSKLTSFIYPF